MSEDMSISHLILQASPVVQVVMLILIIASLTSWTLIIIKMRKLKKAHQSIEVFEDRFWSGISLHKLYDDLTHKQNRRGMARIFYDGFHEFLRLRKPEIPHDLPAIDTIQRTMRVATAREISDLESNLSFLATVGSTSPYIGLLGTVWGIMNAFMSLGQMHQATLAVVAPGIAEALIATAIGLFAAIPAVIAYNHFSDDSERLAVAYENFGEEFMALLERQAISKSQMGITTGK